MTGFKEQLLRTWVDGSDIQDDWRRRGIRNYILTAVKNGVSLFTAPATAQVRSFPGSPYREEPGIGYFFENAEGETVRGFDGDPGGSPSVASFAYFFETFDLAGAEWHAPAKTPEPCP